jgi:hypothetical protein
MRRYGLLVGLLLGAAAGCDPIVAPAIQDEVAPSILEIEVKVFKESCAISGCHNAGTAAGDLVLFNAFENLMGPDGTGVLASNRTASGKGKKLVEPFVPEESYLFQKITEVASGEGAFMPKGRRVISDAAIEAIRLWIEQGALDN